MRISDWSSDVCSSDLGAQYDLEKIAAVDQHGTTEILLDHRPQDEADEDRRELEAQQTQDIADQPEQQDDADIEGAGANAVDADADQANDGRVEKAIGDLQHPDPQADHRDDEAQQQQVADHEAGGEATDEVGMLAHELRPRSEAVDQQGAHHHRHHRAAGDAERQGRNEGGLDRKSTRQNS